MIIDRMLMQVCDRPLLKVINCNRTSVEAIAIPPRKIDRG